MGGTSLVDFLTWIYNNKDMKPWIIVILEALSYLVPVMLFFLFCLNEKVIGQLTEKYPRFTGNVNQKLEKTNVMSTKKHVLILVCLHFW